VADRDFVVIINDKTTPLLSTTCHKLSQVYRASGLSLS